MSETLYSSSYQPDPRSARDVLAFVLTPPRAFAQDSDELAAITELLDSAKAEAIERYFALRRQAICEPIPS